MIEEISSERSSQSDYSGCHCEQSEAIPTPRIGDCFGTKTVPRNDTG
jgi:hypothetical protein